MNLNTVQQSLLKGIILSTIMFFGLSINAQVSNQPLIIERGSGNLGIRLKAPFGGGNSPHIMFDAKQGDPSVNSIYMLRQEGNGLTFTKFDSDSPFSGLKQLLTMRANGNVGIGTNNPQSRLDVRGDVNSNTGFFISGNNQDSRFSLDGGGNAGIELRDGATPYIDFANGNDPNTDFNARLILSNENQLSLIGAGLAINSGYVPFGYRLSVNGQIISTGLTIQPSGAWPDYVFTSDYDLMPLEEVGDFIETNGHLPNVPSAKSIAETGTFDVATIQQLLLEKIEELTLHTIEQQKQLNIQTQQIKDLTKSLQTK